MVKVRLSPAARADLVEIDAYSAGEFGADVADAYVRGFQEVFLKLAQHPHIGPARPEYGRGVRCVMHRSHRVLYRHLDEAVLILRILHHARQVRLGSPS